MTLIANYPTNLPLPNKDSYKITFNNTSVFADTEGSYKSAVPKTTSTQIIFTFNITFQKNCNWNQFVNFLNNDWQYGSIPLSIKLIFGSTLKDTIVQLIADPQFSFTETTVTASFKFITENIDIISEKEYFDDKDDDDDLLQILREVSNVIKYDFPLLKFKKFNTDVCCRNC